MSEIKKFDMPKSLEGSMYSAILATANMYPDNLAIECGTDKLTYSQLLRLISAENRRLAALGVGTGSRVAIVLPNSVRAVVAVYAANALGAAAVMCPTFIQAERLCSTVAALGCRAAFVAEGAEIPLGDCAVITNLATDDGDIAEPLSADPNIDAVIMFSGGTTGRSKAVALTNRNLNSCAAQIAAFSGVSDLSKEKMLCLLPLFHGFGLAVGLHTMMCFGGSSLLVAGFSQERAAELLFNSRPNLIPGVPSFFKKLISAQIPQTADLSFIHEVFTGGDALDVSLKAEIDDFLRTRSSRAVARQGYGMTECVTVCAYMPPNGDRAGSIGVAMPDMRIRIFSPSSGSEVPIGEIGELCISGPTVMRGYIGEEQETAAAFFTDENGTRWLRSGDLGTLDADGYLYFKQRLKRMIVTNGYNVFPSSVEEVVLRLDCVEDCCVVGKPDEQRGERVAIFVTLKDGTDRSLAAEQIRALLVRECEPYVAHAEINVIAAMPRTMLGKIDFKQLRYN